MNGHPPNPELAAMPNLFLLKPKNRAFVEGTSSQIEIWGAFKWTSLVMIFAMLMALLIWAKLSELGIRIGMGGLIVAIIIAFIGPLIIPSVWRRRRQERLTKEGCLLKGELVNYTTKEVVDEAGSAGFDIALEYTFYTPDGRKTDAKEKRWLAWALNTTPILGAPLAVLYVNDHLYEVL